MRIEEVIRLPEVQSYIKKKLARFRQKILLDANRKALMVNCLYTWQLFMLDKTLSIVKDKYGLTQKDAIVLSACDAGEKLLDEGGYFDKLTLFKSIPHYSKSGIELSLTKLKKKGFIKKQRWDNISDRKKVKIKSIVGEQVSLYKITDEGMDVVRFIEESVQNSTSLTQAKFGYNHIARKDAIENLVRIYKHYNQDKHSLQSELSELLDKIK